MAQFLGKLEAESHHWIAMGDGNMQAEVLEFGWVSKLGAHIVQPGVNTCRQGSGSCIDYHIVCKGLTRWVDVVSEVDVSASTWPHWPVKLALRKELRDVWRRVLVEPRKPPRQAKPGCARPPWRWADVNANMEVAAAAMRVRQRGCGTSCGATLCLHP